VEYDRLGVIYKPIDDPDIYRTLVDAA